MSLDVSKLEKVRELAGGVVQARCPACAEGGGDRKGEHLRVYPDGRFGCCVHPKDGEHRKRIFALAGRKSQPAAAGSFSLRIKAPPALPAARSVKGALMGDCGMRDAGCGVGKAATGEDGTNGTSGTAGMGKSESEEGVPESATSHIMGFRTLRTPVSESEQGGPCAPPSPVDEVRTGRTPIFKSRAYAREGSPIIYTPTHMCKEWESGVLPVLEEKDQRDSSDQRGAEPRLPFLTADGTLSIPFDSPERYHWWKPGERLSVEETLQEVRERMKHGVSV